VRTRCAIRFARVRLAPSDPARDIVWLPNTDQGPVVASLDLKMVLHRGPAVRQSVGSSTELLGPAVNVAHRLLKNTVQSRLGHHPYLFVTDAAAAGLELTGIGVEHVEDYPDVGPVHGWVIEIGERSPQAVSGTTG